MDDLLLLVIQDVLNGSSYQFRKEKQKKGEILIEMVLCVIHVHGGVWIAVIESDGENRGKI